MAKDLWRTTTGNTNYYSGSTGNTEPDMRVEFARTLDGSIPEIAKGQPALLRIMRLDTDGNKIACECVDDFTREPDKDRFCPFCYGMGFYWDETLIDTYKVLEGSDTRNTLLDDQVQPGLLNIPLSVFYIRYSKDITKEDRIVLIDLDNDGSASTPMKRKGIYRINSLWDYRADNGKLEYWKAYAHEEKVKFLNTPTHSELQ